MKMVKTLLLGTAAGFVAVAGAQAADMPVKAAVAYVKICNLYGDGFYYLPGTDICVKIGGYVRFETSYGSGTSMTNWGPFGGQAGGGIYNTRSDGADWLHRNRAYISMDTRQQTEYGVLRTYLNMGVNTDSPAAPAANINRAFIQFAGFTVGLAQSFFDFYSVPVSSYYGTLSSDTGDGGWRVAAYTQNWGNGITTTVSLEEPRRTQVWNTNLVNNVFSFAGGTQVGTSVPFGTTDQFVLGSAVNANSGTATIKERMPDLVAAWRIEQAWGSAQVMFAAHDVSGSYYAAPDQLPTTLPGGAIPPGANLLALPIASTCANNGITVTGAPSGGGAGNNPPTFSGGTMTASEICGHPADKVGWAAGIGSRFNFTGTLGDYFQWQFTYSRGATRYVAVTQSGGNGAQGNNPAYFTGATLGYGFWSDGVYSTSTGDVRLTRSWGLNAAYDHLWTKAFRTSIYGAYFKMDYDADANAAICAAQQLALPTQSAATGAITSGGTLKAITGCDNNWGVWSIGTRTQYNFTPAMYVGLDVMWWKLLTASQGTAFYTAIAPAAVPSAAYTVKDQSNVQFRVRFHRDILP